MWSLGATGFGVPAGPLTGAAWMCNLVPPWSVSRPTSGVTHGIVWQRCVGQASRLGAPHSVWEPAGLTCGSSGPQHSPPQPPSSPLPTGAAWSRGPSRSWARPEGERTQGEGWGRRHVGMRSPGASRQARGKSSPSARPRSVLSRCQEPSSLLGSPWNPGEVGLP